MMYDWLLRVYPPAFRRRFAADMRATFALASTDARRAGPAQVILLWVVTAYGPPAIA